MKHTIFASATICAVIWSCAPRPAFANAPQPGVLQASLANSTISLGEPLMLKYQITNLEDRRVDVYMGRDKRDWLSMSLVDASGHLVQAIPDAVPVKGGLHTDGIVVDASGYDGDYVVISQKFQIPHPGQYRLTLASHLTYTWDDAHEEKSTDDQQFSLPVTVTARDPKRLRTIAEGLRHSVLQDKDVARHQLATQALFSMRDAECLPVWRELATDPSLDPWRALDVVRQLADNGSVKASDILAEMQMIAPERWSQTGSSPLDALERMQRNAAPDVKQHIAQVLADAGVSLNHAPLGSAN